MGRRVSVSRSARAWMRVSLRHRHPELCPLVIPPCLRSEQPCGTLPGRCYPFGIRGTSSKSAESPVSVRDLALSGAMPEAGRVGNPAAIGGTVQHQTSALLLVVTGVAELKIGLGRSGRGRHDGGNRGGTRGLHRRGRRERSPGDRWWSPPDRCRGPACWEARPASWPRATGPTGRWT